MVVTLQVLDPSHAQNHLRVTHRRFLLSRGILATVLYIQVDSSARVIHPFATRLATRDKATCKANQGSLPSNLTRRSRENVPVNVCTLAYHASSLLRDHHT